MRSAPYRSGGARHRNSGDPHFADVVLGIDYDGVSGQTVFTDWSSYAHPLFSHNTTVDTANPLFGTGGGIMAGNHNVQANDAPELRLATGPFTLESAVKMRTFASNGIVFTKCISTGFYPYLLYVSTLGVPIFQAFDSVSNLVVSISGPTLAIGVYYRLAVTRDTANNLVVLWLDGVAVSSVALPAATVLWSDIGPVLFGQFATFAASIDAYQDESRFTAYCRYPGTTSYTPATAAFPHFA